MSRSPGGQHPAPPTRPGSWAGLDSSERASTRRSLLLAAASEILLEDDESELTLRAIARRARLHTRYFYESFPDVEALLGELFDAVYEDLHATVLTAPNFDDPEEVRLNKRVRAMFRYFEESPERAAVIVTGAPNSRTLRGRRESRRKEFFAPLIAAEDPTPLSLDDELRQLAAFGAVNEILRCWIEGAIDAGTAEVADRVAQILAGIGTQIKPMPR